MAFQPVKHKPDGTPWPLHYCPYSKQPMKTCWWKGVDAYRRGQSCEPPYTNHSSHGGTWGTRANRIWQEGWWCARKADTSRRG
jgi:hypothetical protein